MLTKIVVIGATGSARKRTAPALKDRTDIKITAVQGRSEEKLIEMCKEYAIPKYYTDAETMLKNEDYDMIYIANPPFMHFADIKMCFDFGKPIICEKPLCLNSAQTYEIVKAAEENRINLTVAHQMRHQNAYDFIKRCIDNGILGEIRFAYAKWDYILDTSKPSSLWKTDFEKSGGGVMNDVGIHLLDFVVGLFGAPNRIRGWGDRGALGTVYAAESAVLEYDGFPCILKCSFEKENTDNDFMIIGSNLCINIPNAMGEKSIKYLHIDSREGRKTVYFKDENLYENEVSDFVRYLNGDKSVENRISTIEDALLCAEITDVLRAFYV